MKAFTPFLTKHTKIFRELIEVALEEEHLFVHIASQSLERRKRLLNKFSVILGIAVSIKVADNVNK